MLAWGMLTMASISLRPKSAVADSSSIAAIDSSNERIDLNTSEPVITDVCWMDIQIGDAENAVKERIEIGLYGEVCPQTVNNFKLLCANEASSLVSDSKPYGYKGSELFRVISKFSVQGGNLNIGMKPSDYGVASKKGRYGKSAINDGKGFLPENYRILHSYKDAGVVSMMKDITNKNLQDSRFFITFEPYASWADDKYVAFGRVTKGMPFIQSLQIVPVQSPANYPLSNLRITDCGVYSGGFLTL